ncbi:MAG: DUF2786 domain-containing protein [Betaproteobacteria bacterium]|nr:DUF2786 domain-containing protein [Betaproteobacteria bacterium]
MANDARGNEHENETAMRMAEKLMRQHNIDVADLEATTGKQTIYNWRSVTIPVGEQAKPCNWSPMWMGFLGVGVGRFTDCRATWVDDAQYQRCMKFQGDETDIEYAAWLFKMLRDHGYAESKSVAGRHRETFRKAYAIRLCERMTTLRAERDVAMKEAVTKTGTALMVVQNKLALRDAEFGKQKVRNRSTKFASDGFTQGRAAAEKVQFNRPIGSSAQPRRLS